MLRKAAKSVGAAISSAEHAALLDEAFKPDPTVPPVCGTLTAQRIRAVLQKTNSHPLSRYGSRGRALIGRAQGRVCPPAAGRARGHRLRRHGVSRRPVARPRCGLDEHEPDGTPWCAADPTREAALLLDVSYGSVVDWHVDGERDTSVALRTTKSVAVGGAPILLTLHSQKDLTPLVRKLHESIKACAADRR